MINEIFLRLLSRPADEEELAASLAMLDAVDKDHENIVRKVQERETLLKEETVKAEKAREAKIVQAKKSLDDYKAGIAEREAKLNKEQADRIAAADKSVKDFEATIPQKVSEWAKANSTDSSWEVVNPIGFNTSNGSKLELENDSSLFASGKNGVCCLLYTSPSPRDRG